MAAPPPVRRRAPGSPPPLPRATPTPTEDTPGTRIYYSYLYSKKALQHYNQNHQNKFKLVVPLCYKTFSATFPKTSNRHLGFIAESEQSSEHKLFFADFSLDHTPITCSIVEPGNPFYEIGCIRCHHHGPIYHPVIGYQGSQLSPWQLQRAYPRLDPYEEAAKQLLSDAYTITSDVQELDTEDANELKRTTDVYVLKALDQYNNENHASFKHLETVFAVRFRHNVLRKGIFWVHLIFKASNDGSDPMEDSPIYLFAELGLDSDFVTCVAISDTDSAGSSFPGGETSSDIYPNHCPLHPEGVYADCKRGLFADSLKNGQCWAVKSELQQKSGEASQIAWMEHHLQMRRRPCS